MLFCKYVCRRLSAAALYRLLYRKTGKFTGFWVDLFGKLCLTETVSYLEYRTDSGLKIIRQAALQRSIVQTADKVVDRPLTGIGKICSIEVSP